MTDPKPMRWLICDDCGRKARKPAINLSLMVFCRRCAPRHGMAPGEFNPIRSYEEWRDIAQDHQYPEERQP